MAQPSPNLASVLAVALALPPPERLQLVDALLESVGRPSGVLSLEDPATVAELDRRADEVDRDPSRTRPWSEVRAELFARVARR